MEPMRQGEPDTPTRRLPFRRKGKGLPLVLVHGFLAGSVIWREQLHAFSAAHDVICPDLAGFGDSSALTALDTIEGHARAVLGLMDDLAISRFDLLGHSMGGMVVQEMVRLAPQRVRNLILYGTGPQGVLPGRFETIAQSRERFLRDGVAETGARIAATWFLDGKNAKGYERCRSTSSRVRMQTALASLTAWEGWDGRAALTNFRARTLVLWGSRDRSYEWSQPELLWRSIPGADLAVVPGAAHIVHMEKPRLFNAIVAEFLTTGSIESNCDTSNKPEL
ncbi:alpha/beta fold hydrolase (plasmid) [Ensifer adhaerens]|uniref:alpha/beta fold hydrolase n=1 Tax=Ensifer adhaerens TaxID=106592 RepID=UPI00399B09EE